MSDQPPLHRLDYSPGRPPRKWLRRLVIAIIAASLIGTGVKYWPAVRDRAVVLYWQRQCMNFQPPGPDTVVFDVFYDLKPTDAVPQPPRGYVAWFPYGVQWPGTFHPDCPVVRAPICWGNFVKATTLYPYDNPPNAIVFLQARHSPCGLERLIAVVRWENYLHPEYTTLEASIVVPGDALHLPKLQADGFDDLQCARDQFRGDTVRKIFAGVADPDDQSKFTIEFEWLDGVRGIVDGQLLDTGHVNLTIRPGPGDYDSYEKRRQNRNTTQPAN
jgi:hypothetical protein